MATLATRISAIPAPWRATLRSFTVSGGSALASGLLTLVSTKVIAVMLGPAHLAVLGSLQQLRQTATVAATMNGQTGLVQGVSGRVGESRAEFLRTVAILMVAASVVVTGVMVFAPSVVAQQVGLASAEMIPSMAPVVCAGCAYVFFAALVNAEGAVGSLAKLQSLGPAVMAILSFPVARTVAASGDPWFVALLLGSSGLASVGAFLKWKTSHGSLATGGRWWSTDAALQFASISGSLFASGVLASWVLMSVRSRILRTEGMSTGGSFDAAWAISANQAGLALASMQAYLLPTLARSPREERSTELRRVLTIAAAASAVCIGVLTAMRSELIQLLYSAEFLPAARYLRWTLAGDYLRISSWILSTAMIASAQMRAFLLADVVAYLTFGAGSWALSRLFPAGEAAAMAFVAMYAIHFAFCGSWLLARGELRLDRKTCAVWLAGLAMVTCATALSWEAL